MYNYIFLFLLCFILSSCTFNPMGVPKDNHFGVKVETFNVHSPLPIDKEGYDEAQKVDISNTLIGFEFQTIRRFQSDISKFSGFNASLLFNNGSFVNGGMLNNHILVGKELANRKTEVHGFLGYGIYAFSRFTGALGLYAGGGISHNMSKDVNLALDYKLHSFKLTESGLNADEIYSASSLSLGVKYRF